MRPDEEAAAAEIERDRQMRSMLAKGAKSVGTVAAGGLAARMMPLLSELVPTDFAYHAISKIAPRIGAFLKKGKDEGLDLREGINYLRDNLFAEKKQEEEEKKQGTKAQADTKNIVQRYSPGLHQYIVEQIGNGRSAVEAGALATLDKSHAAAIKKIVADAKTPWSEIVESSYGATGSIPNRGETMQQDVGSRPQESMRSGKATGSGQQALAEILAKINARLGQQ